MQKTESARGVQTPASVATAPKIGLAWLVKLRWGAVLGQLAITALAAWALRLSLPLPPLLALVALTAASNVAVAFWLGRREPAAYVVDAILILDVATLTALLLCAGGASNPFSVFYLVHVALAALLLTPRRAWFVAGLTSLAFGSLFVLPSHTVDAHAMHMHHGASSLHLQGMWLAYSLAAAFVTHFVSRVASALQAREHELFELQRSAARTEKLASLSTLAAGAAHELGTPLGTIALVAKELERGLERLPESGALVSDAQLIRAEVARCCDILQQMAARAGEGAGEMPVRVSFSALETSLSKALGQDAERVAFEPCPDDHSLLVPPKLLTQVLANLVRNACDAHTEAGQTAPVVFRSRIESALACFEVADRGIGIPERSRPRIGEPFFTTKGPGQGLGLGVFLARAFAEKMGGQLEMTARPGGGTLACLTLPRDVLGAQSEP